MNWYNPDAKPGETEEEYEARIEAERRSTDGLLITIMQLAFLIGKIASIFGIFIYAAYRLAIKTLPANSDNLKIWACTFLFTYLIFCIIYFIKGAIIGLRARERKLWIIPWIVCVVICCLLPAFIIKALVMAMFNFTVRQEWWCIAICWGTFIISSIYIHGIYQFTKPYSPQLVTWTCRLGIRIVQ